MIVNERVVSFINSLNPEIDDLVYQIEREAREEEVPIVRTETRELLKVLELIQKPQRILEVGTAVGFSSIYMSQYLPEGGSITTIEKYPPRIEAAKKNFIRTGTTDRITLLEGDAADILKTLTQEYDMIFMDAAKGQYIHFLPDVLRLLAPDGLLFSDNVLQDGDVLESRFAVTRRNRTIHSRMREYLTMLTHTPELTTSVIPIGDGVSLTMKKNTEEM